MLLKITFDAIVLYPLDDIHIVPLVVQQYVGDSYFDQTMVVQDEQP